ncbi:MAG: hypothetical protein SFY69_04995 [Planctomycetota bacterium]|nr:hypothetical protein [Planctomycetota bacterium]
MRKSLLIALAAGTLCPAALAQVSESTTPAPFGGHVVINQDGAPPFGDRAIGVVYDNGSNVFGGGGQLVVLGTTNALDDVNLAPGPWAGLTGRAITSINWFVQTSGTACGNGSGTGPVNPFDVVMDFYTAADFTAPNMLTPATPFGTVRIPIAAGGLDCGFIWSVTSALTVPLPVPDGTNQIYIQTRFVQTGTNTLLPFASAGTGTQWAFPVWGLEPTTRVGASVSSYGRDINGNSVFAGGTPIITGAGAGAHEHRETNAGAPVRGLVIRLFGDIPPPPPPTGIDLGCVTDGTTVVNNAGGTGVQWYQVCVAQGAEDVALKYFDIDSEGSGSDVAIGLYGADGNLAGQSGSDDNDGSGNNAQLTFGVGRRAEVADGLQYDGRDGQLAAGTYYLAVAPTGSSFGANAFGVSPVGTNGAFTLNIRTNTNGAPAPASVTPLINHQDYAASPPGGPIVYPDFRQGTATDSGLRGVLWSRFELTATAGAGDSFLDIDFARLSTPIADGVAYIFNSNGDLVAFSDDEGEAALPQFSFGAGSGPRTYPPAVNTFEGLNGTLPAGTYYMASALFATQDLQPINDGRFHVRGTSGSNLTLGADIYTGGTPTTPCDPDVNQDGNVDQDDISCLAQAVAGDPTCLGGGVDPDFNRDGNVDQDDIAALEQVVGGAPCP